MRPGERFLLDQFELEATPDRYRCASLHEAERKIAACRYLRL